MILSSGEGRASLASLFLRWTLGVVMLAHGLQQTFGLLGGIGLNAKMAYYADTFQVPKVVGFVGILIISVGALALILGFWSRIMAFLIGSFVVTAMLLGGHIQNGIFMNWEGQRPGEGFEYHILGIGIALAILMLGSGKISLDHLLKGKRRR